jgi:DNA-binding FrmR family transcriptional regulator
MPKDTPTKHPSHHAELKKLNRAAGQIEGIRKMIEDCKYCPDIITQLRAARAALRAVEASILETHLQSCVADALMSGRPKDAMARIEELKTLFKRFD